MTNNCKVNKVCLPCPILHYSLSEVSYCISVLQHRENFIADMLKKKVYIKKDIHCIYTSDKIKIWNNIFKCYQSIEKSGLVIWKMVYNSPGIEIKYLVDKILTVFTCLPLKREIEEDVVVFIYDLYLSNFVELC